MDQYAILAALALGNQATMFSADNFRRVGNTVILSPTAAMGTALRPDTFYGLGYFEPDAQIAPETDVTRNEITVQNPQGGQPIVLMEDVSEVSAVYTVEAVTPDMAVQALHLGSVPTALTDAAVDGSTISPFDVGMSVEARMMVIRILEANASGQRYELLWHPRVAVQNDGFGEYEGRTTRQFRIPVRTWLGSFTQSGELAQFNGRKSGMGAIFSGPIDELAALVDILKGEALPQGVVYPAAGA